MVGCSVNIYHGAKESPCERSDLSLWDRLAVDDMNLERNDGLPEGNRVGRKPFEARRIAKAEG